MNKFASSTSNIVKRLARGNIKPMMRGDLVEAQLVERGPKSSYYFDLGPFGIGIIYGAEAIASREALKDLKAGDKILVKISDTENERGFIELSFGDVARQKTFQDFKELKDANEALTIKITGANNGGLLGEVNGQRCFLPISQLKFEHYPKAEAREQIVEELKKLIGQEMKARIVELNQRTRKVVVSEKDIYDENVQSKVAQYKPGDIIDGIVSGVASFGVFIKFANDPQVEGLVHISELDHSFVDNPKEIVNINDSVKAKIIEINSNKIFLSIKALKPNPWETILQKYQPGQDVDGAVYKFHPFGAFIKLENNLVGLVHISEFGSSEAMRAKLEIGKSYKFKIDTVKPEEKRIILKFKDQ